MTAQKNDVVLVRPLQPDDTPTLLDLIDAMADYEHLTPPDLAARERLVRDAIASPPRFSVFLGERAGRVVGYAFFFETYSSFLARPTLYLEDIFVLEEERRHGVGQALFRACVREGLRRGCGRMEWQVLKWNALAVGFYEKHGAKRLDEWQSYRLDADALGRLAD